MTRFSLSPVNVVEEDAWGGLSLSKNHHRHDADDDKKDMIEDDDDALTYSDDDDDEPAHPLGFSSTTRFALDPKNSESMEHYKRRWGYVYPYENNDFNDNDWFTDDDDDEMSNPLQQTYPPLSSYRDAQTAPTAAILRYQQEELLLPRSDNHDIMDRLACLLQAAVVLRDDKQQQLAATARAELSPLPAYFSPQAVAQERRQVQQEMDLVRKEMEQDHAQAAQALMKLIRQEETKAAKIRAEQKKQQEELQRQERLRKEEQERKEQARRKEQDRLRKEQEEKKKEKEEAEALAEARAKKEQEQKSKEHEYIERAQKHVAQLVQVRSSVEPFEKLKEVAKRRLGMKKIVNGKVNTLAENVDKIRSVAADVSQAIAQARAEDEQIKQQLQAGAPNVTPEMTRGKRYLIDLLSAKVVVRVQAEGFNGQRGDGFPLAAMLAMVSVDNKDLVPVLQAHIHTVCPTAIPNLPHPAPDASEDEVMESLGMLKGKDGSFETFERFLSRTEGIISIVADIMASQPSNHVLFGGHEGAVKWLKRFLSHLPPAPQSPLPLLTAPVLDAFLTGAGHMLANIHPESFKKYLAEIETDIIHRLDESAIGKPSATRLKKTVEGGFDKFKDRLPSKALAELYHGANVSASGGGHGVSSSVSPFGSSSTTTTSTQNPFGAPTSSATPAPSPFASSQQSTTTNPFVAPQQQSGPSTSPFGTQPPAPSTSPFGTQKSAPSPFASSQQSTTGPFAAPQQESAPAPAFGGGFGGSAPAPAMAMGLFGSPAPAPAFGGGGGFGAPAPPPSGGLFGAPAPAPTMGNLFGSSPAPAPAFGGGFGAAPAPVGGMFGSTTASAPSGGLFGSSSASTPSPFVQPGNTASAFGAPSTTGGFGASTSTTSASSSFGSTFGSTATQSPFGGAAPAPTPFGSAQPATFGTQPFGNAGMNASPFGGTTIATTGNTPFGSEQTFGATGGGGGKKPCKYFAEGRCRFGANCKFSHEQQPNQPNTFGFSSNSPFGAPRR